MELSELDEILDKIINQSREEQRKTLKALIIKHRNLIYTSWKDSCAMNGLCHLSKLINK